MAETPTLPKTQKLNQTLIRAMLAQGASKAILQRGKQMLPASVDDAERDFGLNLYDRMLNDPACNSAVDMLAIATLSDGYRLLPSHKAPKEGGGPSDDDTTPEDYARSLEIRDFVQENLDRCQPGFETVLENMMDAVVYGHKIAEIELEPVADKWMLKYLLPRPKDLYGWIIDEFMHVDGIQPRERGQGKYGGAIVGTEPVLPLQKFMIFSMGSKDGDPRGRSQFRAAYIAWHMKQHVWPGWDKFLNKFASPSLVGILPESLVQTDSAAPANNEDGLDDTTPEDEFMAKLLEFENTSVIAAAFGSSITVVEPKTNGEAYHMAMEILDKQIHMAILSSIRATLEAKHGSKADSETAEATIMRIARAMRRRLESVVDRQLIYLLVVVNYSEEDAKKYCPHLSLSKNPDMEQQIELMKVIGELWQKKFFHISQLEDLDAMIGAPKRDLKAMMEEMAEQQDMMRQEARLRSSLMEPDA